MITSIALVAITVALLLIVAHVSKLWAAVHSQTYLLEDSRLRIAKLEAGLRQAAFDAGTETIRLSFRVSKLERAAEESGLGDATEAGPP